MSLDPLERLVDRLRNGDFAAADELVVAYEPYLRAVVRRDLSPPLRAKFDSADVVQSVWVHLLHGLRGGNWQINDSASLRALLVTVARRRLISRVRHHRSALEHEQPGDAALEGVAARHQPRPSEVAQATELWETMLELCPPAHRQLLYLRQQGLTLDEIAARTGLHEGSVRRILRQLPRDLALRREPLAAASANSGEVMS